MQEKPNESFKCLIYEFLTSPWCYGLSKVLNKSNIWSRLLWAVSFITSLVLCTIAIKSNIDGYLEYNVIERVTKIYNSSIIFPQVTFCRLDDMNYEYSKLDCTFNGDLSCNTSLKYHYVIDPTGIKQKCLQFNSGTDMMGNSIEIKRQTVGNNVLAGISIHVEFPEVNHSNPNMVYINENKEIPMLISPDLLFSNPAFVTVKIKKTVRRNLEYPYNSCSKDTDIKMIEKSDLFKRTLRLNNRYEKSKCYFLCKLKYFAEHNKCSYPGVYETTYSKNCTDNLLNEEFQILNLRFDQEKECSEFCPLECDKTTFSLTINQINKYSNLNEKSFKFFLTFEDLEYSEIIQSPAITAWDLASKLGGLLGLFLGFKILSFIDFFELFCDVSILGCKKIRKKCN